jgi:hypothetical protein
MGGPGSGGVRPYSTEPRSCEYCGDTYTPRGNRTKYCQECAPNRWASGLIRRYGISFKDYAEMLDEQEYSCAICMTPFRTKELPVWDPSKMMPRTDMHVDHDHVTGWVRGILCLSCNTRLSGIEDEKWHDRAIKYLEESS